MPLQSGANNRLFMRKEASTAYGTSPGGNFASFPFFNMGLGAEQPLITPTVIGVSTNRDPGAPIRDVVTVSGDIEVPVDLNNFGHWLNMALGAPVQTNVSTDFTYTFRSGAASLPSYHVEHAQPQVPNFSLIGGVMVGGFRMQFQPQGEARATFNCVGQGQTNNGTSSAGTTTAAAFAPFGQFQGSIRRNTTALANVSEASLNYSANLEPVRTIRADGRVDGFIPGINSIAGSLTVYFADTTLLTQATSGAASSIELAYTISATQSLTLTLHDVFLPVPKLVTSGPQGMRATFNFQAAFNSGQATALTAVLRNQVSAGY